MAETEPHAQLDAVRPSRILAWPSLTNRSAWVERSDAPEEFGARVWGPAENQVEHEFPVIMVGGDGDLR